MTIAVVSPNIAKESAKFLSDSLADQGIKSDFFNLHETEKRDFSSYKKVINYGWSKHIKGNLIFNNQASINTSRDKVETLKLLKGVVPCILMTDKYAEALQWIKEKRIVVARHLTMGDNGKGVEFCKTVKQLEKNEDAKFFTRFIEHEMEYRINVFKGKVISVYAKSVDTTNHFKFTLVKPTPEMIEFGTRVYETLGLEWMGLDIIKTQNNNYYFLEANSAPVLFPYTTKKLIAEIIK